MTRRNDDGDVPQGSSVPSTVVEVEDNRSPPEKHVERHAVRLQDASSILAWSTISRLWGNADPQARGACARNSVSVRVRAAAPLADYPNLAEGAGLDPANVSVRV